jgi:hypothetical protein
MRAGFVELAARLGEKALFVGDPAPRSVSKSPRSTGSSW